VCHPNKFWTDLIDFYETELGIRTIEGDSNAIILISYSFGHSKMADDETSDVGEKLAPVNEEPWYFYVDIFSKV
jgi:hypothetical protein